MSEIENVTVAAAFLGGLVSFLSPCVLPLVPAYLSFISGVSLEEMRSGEGSARGKWLAVLGHASLFILGFSAVFVILGASANLFLGRFLLARQGTLRVAAGILVIVFGLHVGGILKLPFLEVEKRFQHKKRPAGMAGAFLVGIAFALGWSPCLGPVLSAILALAGFEEHLGRAVSLLAVYSAGLGVPFLLSAAAVDSFLSFSKRLKAHFRPVEIGSGILLVLMGLLIMTNEIGSLSAWFARILPEGLASGG